MKRAFTHIIILCCLAIFGPTASAEAAPRPWRLLMLWVPQAEFAGFYMAERDGLYRKAGLEVQILHPQPHEDVFDALKQDRADFVVAWLTSSLARALAGDDVVSVAQLHQRSALMMIARRSAGLRKPEDISGRRVGMWIAPSLRTPIIRYFKQHGIHDCRILPVLTTVDLFLHDGVDVTVGMEFDEYYRIYMAGVNPDELTIFRFNDTFPGLADDGIFCKRSTLEQFPEQVRKLRLATLEGWRRAFADKEQTLKLIRKVCEREKIPFNMAHQRHMLNVMEHLMTTDGNRDGLLKPTTFEHTLKILDAAPEHLRFESFAPEMAQ